MLNPEVINGFVHKCNAEIAFFSVDQIISVAQTSGLFLSFTVNIQSCILAKPVLYPDAHRDQCLFR
jgi:hypothetical protein